MKKLLTLSIVMTTFMLVFIGQAADSPRFKVSVVVGSDDKNTKAFIESHIKRELRSLRDVDVVKNNTETNDFHIMITATGSKNGTIAIFSNFYNYFNDDDIKTLMNQEDLRFVKLLLNVELRTRTEKYVRFSRAEDLDELCKDIVVYFDTEKLDPLRQR